MIVTRITFMIVYFLSYYYLQKEKEGELFFWKSVLIYTMISSLLIEMGVVN